MVILKPNSSPRNGKNRQKPQVSGDLRRLSMFGPSKNAGHAGPDQGESAPVASRAGLPAEGKTGDQRLAPGY